ncbi:hypothetical protein BGX26_007607 [Mortierella sp. AD094]|nr:hypothetical protein BGX26_007607 [Mortierella sp. AD094]
MSHYLQYQQQQQQYQQQLYQNAYHSKQQQQQQQQTQQTQQTMTYYQIPAVLNMSSVQQQCNLSNESSMDIGYSSNYLGMNLPSSNPTQQASANCSSDPPSLISIRRDSGFAHSSLDELTMGIMSNKVALASNQPSEHNINNLNSNNTSFLLSTPVTTELEGPAPIVPSMSNGMGYMMNNVQHMLLAQQQQQQNQHSTPSISSPTSHSATYSFPSTAYEMQQQQMPSQQALMSPLQYHPRHGQIQRPRQRKPQLQIVTESELGQQIPMTASNGNVIISSFSNPSVNWESCDMNQSSAAPVTSPSMSAASNIIQAGQQGYPWGFVSSPIESSFSSSSSTPFASPSSSYAHSDMPASCGSSRAASPSLNHSSVYDAYLSERRFKRESDGSSSLIIRSRKSSTSSTSSTGSQRRASNLRESSACGLSTGPSSPRTNQVTSTSSPTHQCPKCGQCFAGPAVLVRHIESIHDKLLWNCVGCKSNLSRRDAVTRHINLSPMDSVCRAVGTIGQVKTSNGVEVHYEISSYRAKPLDEVMSRMGKKISTALRKEIDRSKAAMQMKEVAAATATAGFSTANTINASGMPEASLIMMNVPRGCLLSTSDVMEMKSEGEDILKQRRRSLVTEDVTLGRKK